MFQYHRKTEITNMVEVIEYQQYWNINLKKGDELPLAFGILLLTTGMTFGITEMKTEAQRQSVYS